MFATNDHSRLYRIFGELQEVGLIDRGRRLVQCPFTFSMRGCPALNSIRYRRAFYERNLSRASDDALRFVLLHEEGHVRMGSSRVSALLALPFLLYLILLHQPFLQVGGLPVGKVASIVLLLLVVFFGYRAYYRRMYDEEFIADRYAADALRRCYQIRDPGTILQNLLSSLRAGAASARRKKRSGLRRIVPDLISSEPGYHPSISERVQSIRDLAGREDRIPVACHSDTDLSR